MKKPIIAAIIAVLLLIVGFAAYRAGSRNSSAPSTNQPSGQSDQSDNEPGQTGGQSAVKDLVTYTLPDGWKEASCDTKPEAVYVLPPDVGVNCNADPSAPVSLTVDPNNTSDCSQLTVSNQSVRKHVCKSQDINGHKSLQASTTYTESSSVAPGMTVSDYYIPAGQKVVKVEYRYTGDAQYQAAFDQLAQSVKSK